MPERESQTPPRSALTADHPALALLADTLRVTSGPAEPETIAGLLGHALKATGYELRELLDIEVRVDRAEAAVLRAHAAEQRAYLNGDVSANEWRPRVYAEAAVRAALSDDGEREGTSAS